VHAEELKRLAAEAEQAGEDASAELGLRRQMLDLLPPESGQARTIAARVEELSLRVERATGQQPGGERRSLRAAWKSGGGLAALALLGWKLKGLLLLVATKGKLLLLGLTKLGTLSTMLLSLGVYWTAFGWKLAAGLIASIYVHEMGHVAALQRFGIRASLPMFIPGLGAVVRLQQSPANVREDARVGLAGPIWGLGAAIACWLIHLATGSAIWAAIARVGAWINLFNLLPVWQLDGGRGFRALTRGQRLLAAAALAVAWLLTREGLLVLLLLAAGFQAFAAAPREQDRPALAQYVVLIAALSAICLLIPGQP
jgi:Zn-dependent protease